MNDKNDLSLNELETLLESGKLTLLDFWGQNCPGCQALDLQLQKVLQNYNGKINFLKININDHPQLGSRYYVRSLPTLLFIKNRIVKKQLSGAVPASVIEKSIRECL